MHFFPLKSLGNFTVVHIWIRLSLVLPSQMTSLLLWMEKTHMKKWKVLVGTGKPVTQLALMLLLVLCTFSPVLTRVDVCRECKRTQGVSTTDLVGRMLLMTKAHHSNMVRPQTHTNNTSVWASDTTNRWDLKLVFSMDIYFFILLSSLGQFRLSTTHRQLWKSECFINFGSSCRNRE